MPRKHNILAIVLLSTSMTGAALASPGQQRQPPPDSAVSPQLLELRKQLLTTDRDRARADTGRFRALCDDQGYPLVGNIANKKQAYQPSELCAEVRKAAQK